MSDLQLDLPGRLAGRCATCNEMMISRGRRCACEEVPFGCHRMNRRFNPTCDRHRPVYVYALLMGQADRWARAEGIRRKDCYTHGENGGWRHYRDSAGTAHTTMPATGNRVVILGDLGRRTAITLRICLRRYPDLQPEMIKI